MPCHRGQIQHSDVRLGDLEKGVDLGYEAVLMHQALGLRWTSRGRVNFAGKMKGSFLSSEALCFIFCLHCTTEGLGLRDEELKG